MNAPDIYISSVAFSGYTVEEMIASAVENKLNIEFSSGMPFRADMEEIYLSAPLNKLAHNYFPSPSEPFVINLASANTEIREKSINHCINGLHLSKRSGSSFFAAHAGFCIDPVANELGKPLSYQIDFDKEIHWNIFLDSVKRVLKVAEKLQVSFFIENNVLARFNYRDNVNPLFCCDSKEIQELFTAISHPKFGLLLDTAHLKVSCTTLGLNLENELKKVHSYICALHHSDNNGEADTNEPFDNNYWFLPYVNDYNNMIHVIEVKRLSIEAMHKHIKLLQYAVN